MDLLIIVLYFILLAIVSILSYRKGFQNIFRTEKTLPWFLAGFSVFLINPDTFNVLSKMGIVATEGYAGMWIFYTGVFGAGFLPILFAPLWSRLRFMTDNQFILLRFSGRPARILHLFRAVYVGYLVVSLFIAQVFIALSKLLTVFFELTYTQSYLVITLVVIALIAKNSLRLKVRTDLLNGMIYLVAFALGAFYVVKVSGGTGEIYPVLRNDYAGHIRLFPEGWERTSFESLPTLLVYFLVQWWSINVLDGAGPEAQRFMNSRGPFQAFKAAFLPLILFSIVFLSHSFVIDAGILMLNDPTSNLPEINGNRDLEASFIELYRMAMPDGFASLIFLAFFIGLIGFLESFVNWGSSFVVVDVFRTYVWKDRDDRFYSVLSYGMMLLIGISGILIAWFNTYLLGFQKFVFSMGAGVGPVFILRWFWWRINAWSQLTAMLSSLILAVGWDLLYNSSEWFHRLISMQADSLNMSLFAWKLLCLTLLVTFSWLVVTFLSRPDDPETLARFAERVQPGGFWKFGEKRRRTLGGKKAVLLLLYPVVSILPFLIIWQFKFGTTTVAVIMLGIWVGGLVFTVRGMARMNN